MKFKIALLLLTTLGSTAIVAEDQIFKWKDAQGVWHFSSNAPDGVGAQRVSVRHSQTVPDPLPAPAAAAGTSTGTVAAAPATGAAGFIGPQSANCKVAREAVMVLENSPKVSMDSNGDGVQENLTAQQQLEELERRRAQSKVYCAEA